MGRGLTEKNRKYAQFYVIDGCTSSEAYRRAYPEESKGLSSLDVSRKASIVHSGVMVQAEIKRLQAQFEKEGVITRQRLLEDVSELISKAKRNAYEDVMQDDGSIKTIVIPRVADILIKAIDRAAKMIGADEPEQVSGSISVSFESDDFDKYAQ